MARQKDSSQPIFGVTLGSVDAAGEQLADSAIRAGVGTDTSIHGVGDGALSDCQSSQENLRNRGHLPH